MVGDLGRVQEQHGVEVITLTVDLGGGSLRPGVQERAMSAGASRAYVVDARERVDGVEVVAAREVVGAVGIRLSQEEDLFAILAAAGFPAGLMNFDCTSCFC